METDDRRREIDERRKRRRGRRGGRALAYASGRRPAEGLTGDKYETARGADRGDAERNTAAAGLQAQLFFFFFEREDASATLHSP